MNASLTIVVCSCDAYSDLWRPFFTLFFRHWPDCPWKVVLISNESQFAHPLVETANIGQLGSWNTELRAVLKRVPSSNVLLMLNDFFLRRAVNQAQIESCFQKLVERDGNMLRLLPRPRPAARLSAAAVRPGFWEFLRECGRAGVLDRWLLPWFPIRRLLGVTIRRFRPPEIPLSGKTAP